MPKVTLLLACLLLIPRLAQAQSSLSYSTFLGAEGNDTANRIIVDEDGAVYVLGQTESETFAGVDGGSDGDANVYLLKFMPGADEPEWTSVLGGTRDEFPGGLCITNGMVFITGSTDSDDLFTLFASQSEIGGYDNRGVGDAFVAGFSVEGTPSFISYFGGERGETGRAIACAPDGSFYITGRTNSDDLPGRGGVQPEKAGQEDAYVAWFSSVGALIGSTHWGGNSRDIGTAIEVSGSGVIVGGETSSTDFPVVPGSTVDAAGLTDAFLLRLALPLDGVTFAMTLGGSQAEEVAAIDVNQDEQIFVFGATSSTDFPLAGASFETDVKTLFLSRYSSSGNLEYSTYVGGSERDFPGDINVNGLRATLVGDALSGDIPIEAPIEGGSTRPGTAAGFVIDLDTGAPPPEALKLGTYLGGSQFLKGDAISGVFAQPGLYWLAGSTSSEDFPTTENALDDSFSGGPSTFARDAFVARIDMGLIVNSTDDDADSNVGDGACDTGQTIATGEPECTLRAALQEANDDPDASLIRFDIAGGGVHRIRPATPLPEIVHPVTIDGDSQSRNGPLPAIVLDGTDLPFTSSSHGLRVSADDTRISTLTIQKFPRRGIHLVGVQNCTIRDNLIGLTADGMDAAGNGEHGIFVQDATLILIDGNTISANGLTGATGGENVTLLRTSSSVVLRNVIGPNWDLSDRLPNRVGIEVLSGSNNTIGGVAGSGGNTIGWTTTAIRISEPGSDGNRVVGNWIGVAQTGKDAFVALPVGTGIEVDAARNTIIGELVGEAGTGGGNTIGHAGLVEEDSPGVDAILISSDSPGTQILGNAIGQNPDGRVDPLAPPINNGSGIKVQSADGTLIRGNSISLSTNAAIWILSASDVRILDNRIGASKPDSVLASPPYGNLDDGIRLDGATRATVTGNLIQGSAMLNPLLGAGIRIKGTGATEHIVLDNSIGFNSGAGVDIDSGNDNVIGDLPGGSPNSFYSNQGPGIRVSSGTGNLLAWNNFSNNVGLGIDLGPFASQRGTDANDALDSDSGANEGLNHPVVVSAVETDDDPVQVQIRGSYAGPPLSPIRILLVAGEDSGILSGIRPDVCHSSGFGEGTVLIQEISVSTDALGRATFRVTAPRGNLTFVSAVAVDASNNTSEFGPCVSIDSASSPPQVVNSIGDAPDLDPADGVCDTGGTASEGSAECTLRAAIEEGNRSPDPSRILFEIPGGPPYVIAPSAPLPPISAPLWIMGASQPGYLADPVVVVQGSGVTAGAGLELSAATLIDALAVAGFPDGGILVRADSSQVTRSVIGSEPSSGAGGNLGPGIRVEANDVAIGGSDPILGNRIASNGGDGVRVESGSRVSIRSNSIEDNGGLGVNLVTDGDDSNGVTPNDESDLDEGVNTLLNAPRLTLDGSSIVVGYQGSPSAALSIDVFANDQCDASGFGEGEELVGSLELMTAVDGTASESSVLELAEGVFVTATATDESGNTSEFSACLALGATATDASPVPTDFALLPAYPNPFNPETTISFNLPVAGPVRLDVVDSLGRLVQTLLSGDRPAGSHRVRWIADAMASGVYLLRLQAGSQVTSQAVVLVK